MAGSLILHDNVRPHIVDVVTKNRDYGWEVLPHAPYSPDMSQPPVISRPHAEGATLCSGETVRTGQCV